MAIGLAHTLTELPEVPSRFVQPLHRRPKPSHGQSSIPVIDLHEQDHITAQALAKACEEWGFFQVINHGISTSLMEDVIRLLKEFLNLPMEEKMKRPMKFDPYYPTGYGRTFDFSEDTILDWGDRLINYLSPPALKDLDYWPDRPTTYRETIEAYGNEVVKLVKTLLGILSKILELNCSQLEETFGGDEAHVILCANHYPRCPQPDLVMGLHAHSDGTAMTILLHDEVEGLQVKKDGLWWSVKPIPGALVVNIGDMMQLVSNGRFISMEHRAVVSSETERISFVLFYVPPLDAILGPIAPKGIEPHDAIYKSIKYGDYWAAFKSTELEGKDRINSLLK